MMIYRMLAESENMVKAFLRTTGALRGEIKYCICDWLSDADSHGYVNIPNMVIQTTI
jgi:hypothetical protein